MMTNGGQYHLKVYLGHGPGLHRGNTEMSAGAGVICSTTPPFLHTPDLHTMPPPTGTVSLDDHPEEASKPTKTNHIVDVKEESPPTTDSTFRSCPVQIEWQDISFSVTIKQGPPCKQTSHKRQILKGVSGSVNPGEFLAIMGASGAGKTTLLNVLAGRTTNGEVGGQVSVNGHPRESESFRDHTAYVMQQDVVMPTLTVRESIQLSADLRLPAAMSQSDKTAAVDVIIRELGLEKCADTLVGNEMIRGVSGGEKKRCSIGVELVTDPDLLFVDEPTSGLDSDTACAVVEKLSRLAASGRTVIATIHQPSSEIFELFDKLLLMVDGQIIYQGPARNAVAYFAAAGFQCPQFSNPADYFMRVMNRDAKDPKVLAALTKAWSEHKTAEDDESGGVSERYSERIKPLKTSTTLRAGLYQQLKLLSQRALKNYLRQPVLTKMRLGQTVFMAVFVGLLYLDLGNNQRSVQDRQGAMFFIVTNNLMLSALSVVLTFPEERLLYERETNNSMYTTFPYFFSKFVSEFPFQIFYPLLYSAIAYPMLGLQSGFGHFFIFLAANIAMVNVGQSLGLAVGCGAPNADSAVGITPAIIIPLMLFAGFFLNTDNIPVYFQWLQWVSPFKYGFEVLAINEFEDLVLTCDADELQGGQCPYRKGEEVLDLLNIDADAVPLDFGLMVVLFFGFRAIAYAFLELRRPKLK